MMEQKRLSNLDVMKCMGILLMIMGHIGFGGKFDRFIHSFHMPLFFIISGFLYKRNSKSLGSFVVRRARTILLPYAFFGLVNYLVWVLLNSKNGDFVTPLIHLISYNTEELPIAGALWFLTVLFFMEIIYASLDRLIHSTKWLHVAVIVISGGMCLVQMFLPFELLWGIDIALACLIFYDFGRFARDTEDKWKDFLEKNQLFNLGLFLCTICFLGAVQVGITFVNPYVNVKCAWYGWFPLTWLNAILGAFICYLIAEEMIRLLGEEHPAIRVACNVGRESLIYLGMNQLVILLLFIAFGALPQYETPYFHLINLVIFPLAVLILYLLSVVFTKTKVRKLIGR